MTDKLTVLKLLADETRVRIINILSEEDSYVELIASKLDLTPATVCYHLKKMEAAGLVKSSRSQFYIIYALEGDVFNRTLGDLLFDKESDAARDEAAREEAYRRRVLSSFFKYGKLTHLPSQRKKREIVLSEIVKDFEVEWDYHEREVNAILTRYHEDYCTLRREMIACGLMTREREIYRRVGTHKEEVT